MTFKMVIFTLNFLTKLLLSFTFFYPQDSNHFLIQQDLNLKFCLGFELSPIETNSYNTLLIKNFFLIMILL